MINKNFLNFLDKMTYDKLLAKNEDKNTESIKFPNSLANSEKQQTIVHRRNHSRNLSNSSFKPKTVRNTNFQRILNYLFR